MTIQIKVAEQYFPLVLFIMLYKVVLTFDSMHKILSVNIQISYRAVLSCGAFYAVQGGLTFESVHNIQKCDHLNASYEAVLSCGAICYAVQGGFKF